MFSPYYMQISFGMCSFCGVFLSRYWTHNLLKEGVVHDAHPCFASWLDIHNAETMFMADQAGDWSEDHLFACHWYIEMDPNETPPHLVELRRQVEPTFHRPAPVQIPGAGKSQAHDVVVGRVHKAKRRTGLSTVAKGPGSAPAVRDSLRDVALKSNKRSAQQPPLEDEIVKRGKHIEGDAQDQTELVEVTQSEARSSRSHSHTGRSFGGAQASVQRTSLISRAPHGADYHEQIENKAVASFLGSDSGVFEDLPERCVSHDLLLAQCRHFLQISFRYLNESCITYSICKM